MLQIHDKGGQALGGRHGAVGQGKDDTHIGKAGVGGEDLGAVEDPVLAVLHGYRLGTLYVGTGVGLRQAKGTDLAAVHQRTQELLLLLLGAVVVDTGAAQGCVHRDGDTGRGVHLGDLLHAQGICQRISAGAAVLAAVGDTEEAVALYLGQQVKIIGFLFVHLLCQRTDLRLGKFTEQFLLQQVHFAQLKVHSLPP